VVSHVTTLGGRLVYQPCAADQTCAEPGGPGPGPGPGPRPGPRPGGLVISPRPGPAPLEASRDALLVVAAPRHINQRVMAWSEGWLV